MQIIRKNGSVEVEASIGEVVQLYKRHLEVYGDQYAYVCSVVRFEVERLRIKQKYEKAVENCKNNYSPFCADPLISANMCMEMLTTAGLSQKGLARLRKYLRESCNFQFVGNTVLDVDSSHMSLDDVIDADQDDYTCKTYPCEPFIARMKELGEDDFRLGVLLEVQKRNPEFVVKLLLNCQG